jgi:tRNA pseudouridine38-40 synthase
VARTYVYRILNRPTRPALGRLHTSWWRQPLDAPRMDSAAQQLRGEHDFSAFRAAECQSKSAVRQLHRVAVTRTADLVSVEVTANAFLHHMVRNIVGALIVVGTGERPESWLAAILAGRDRRHVGITAPAEGLYLAAVHYPPHFGIPVAGTGCSDIIPGPSIRHSGTGA